MAAQNAVQDVSSTSAGTNEAAASSTELAARAASSRAHGKAIVAPAAPPGHGSPPSRSTQAADDTPQAWRLRRDRRLPRLRIGSHVATRERLDCLQITARSFGFVLGRNQAGLPVSLALFQHRPVHVALLGGTWAAKLVAYRSLKCGVRVAVLTDDSTDWTSLGRHATGRPDRLTLTSATPHHRRGTPDAPLLVVDPGDGDTHTTMALDKWHTGLSLIRRPTIAHAPALHGSTMLFVQRLSSSQAEIVTATLGLAPRTSHLLRALHDDMLAVLTPRQTHYVWLHPSQTEHELLGAPALT